MIQVFLALLLVIILIVPIVLQYILNWPLTIISVYGIYLVVYMAIQFILAFINNKYGNKYTKIVSVKNNRCCNLLVVGWREREEYYKLCLDSIKMVSMESNIGLNRIYIIIDGNQSEDQYMVEMAKKIFMNEYVHLIIDNKGVNIDESILSYMNQVINKKVIIVSQPHDGKRMAMYTGLKMSILEKNLYNENLETVFCTDSDTVITKNSITELINKFNHELVGGVTGDLSIYNKYNSQIAFMSKIRYWFAFNLERAYQSFNGCVLCVSGPLGMYKLSSVEKIIDKWRDQKFLGKACTYGDDRHLSNLILSLNEKIIYNNRAYAETETPETIYKFYKQQIRWSKSSFREFFWSILNVDKQSMFMTVDLVYVFLYPFIVMGYMMYLLWYSGLFELGVYLNTVLVISLVKSLYGIIISGIYENLFYVLYSVNYISIVFPARLWALVTITDNSWGTSTRKIGTIENVSFDIVMLILWNVNLLGGFGYSLWRNNIMESNMVELILLCVPLGFIIIGFIVMRIYIVFRKNVESGGKKLD